MSASSPPVLATDPVAAADAAATQSLLNCALREHPGACIPPGAPEVLELPVAHGVLRAAVRRTSATRRWRFVLPPTLERPGRPARPVELDELAALLVGAVQDPAPADGAPPAVLQRIRDSALAVAGFLALRGDELDRLRGPEPLSFIDSEQSLLLGHPLHPTPKSRGEMDEGVRAAYAPEARARFRLRWLAVDPACVVHDSAVGTPAPQLTAALLGADPAAAGHGDRILVPAHPWELDLLRDAGEFDDLLCDGRVVDLGPAGPEVTPTTSVRTVHREDWAWQLKFSLHVRITNSMRVTSHKELLRAVEAARLDASPIGRAARAAAPDLRLVQDPAFLAVRGSDGIVDGLSVLLRDNAFAREHGDVTCVAALCEDHPYGGTSRIGALVGSLARARGEEPAAVGRAWFARYCEVTVASLVRLYLDVGLCCEPHAQNTLVVLRGGWPARCLIRDSQGFFHREAAHADVCAVLPAHGGASESIFPEWLADERLVYYPFVNATLTVVEALGAAGVADEDELLADLRALLERERARGGRYPATLLDRLLDEPSWPCKANLLTRVHDMDELVGDIARQSAYVTMPSPLWGR